MRRFLIPLLVLLPMAASDPLHVAAVERKGWPPFEDDRRVYRLEGAEVAGLRVGEKLRLLRPGQGADPGCLKVTLVGQDFAESLLVERGATYPLKGDLAEPRRALPIPGLPPIPAAPELRVEAPRLEAPPEAASPSRQPAVAAPPAATAAPAHDPEPIFFLEGDAGLSPKGREKLQRLVASWGPRGSWALGLPEDRSLPVRVREARIQALRRAFRGLGVAHLEVRTVELRPGDRGDVVYALKE